MQLLRAPDQRGEPWWMLRNFFLVGVGSMNEPLVAAGPQLESREHVASGGTVALVFCCEWRLLLLEPLTGTPLFLPHQSYHPGGREGVSVKSLGWQDGFLSAATCPCGGSGASCMDRGVAGLRARPFGSLVWDWSGLAPEVLVSTPVS